MGQVIIINSSRSEIVFQDLRKYRKFNENHDEMGRFSSGESGAGPNSGPMDPSVVAWQGLSPSAVSDNQMRLDMARETAKSYGYPPEMVSLGEEGKTFELNGKEMEYGGAAYSDGRIEIFPSVALEDVGGVMDHEIGHQVYNGYLEKLESESSDLRGMSLKEQSEIMYPSGQFRPGYAEKYPATDLENYRVANSKALAESDGVSAYSKEYWTAYSNGTVGTKQVMHLLEQEV
jgi:hypothetical protein